MIVRAAFVTIVLSVLFAIGLWVADGGVMRAQDDPSALAMDAAKWQKFSFPSAGEQPVPGADAWMCGQSVPFAKFGIKESMLWFADFILDPERAANRKVMYLYDLDAVPSDILVAKFKDAMATDFKGNLAFVSIDASKAMLKGLPIAYTAHARGDNEKSMVDMSDIDIKAFIDEAKKAVTCSTGKMTANSRFLAVDKPIEAENLEAVSFVTDMRAWPPLSPEELLDR